MRNVKAPLLAVLMIVPLGAAALDPEANPAVAVALAGPPPSVDQTCPAVPAVPASLPCVDLPLLVDEGGDTMTGDLVMEGAASVVFPGGAVYGAGATDLRYAGRSVCLAAITRAGCGDIEAVGTGFGLTGGAAAGSVSLAVSPAVVQVRVGGNCPAGQAIRSIAQDGSVACDVDDGQVYTGTAPIAVGTSTIGLSSAGCATGAAWKWGGAAWTCQPAGTVTSVGTGAGLTGGPITGAGTLGIATGGVTGAMLQDGTVALADLGTMGCASGQVLKMNAGATAWGCAADVDTDTDTNSGGTVTTIFTGNGLTGGPISTTGTLSLMTCAPGQVLRVTAPGNVWGCGTAATNNGTVTSVAAGSGLTGGPITTTGTLSIATGGVATAMLADDAVTAAKVAAGAIDNAALANQAVDSAKVKDFSLTGGDIANVTITTLKLADGAVTTAKLGFDPATQAELDAHGNGADHDERYSQRDHGHDVASSGGTSTIFFGTSSTAPATLESVTVTVPDECAGAENHRYLVQGGFTATPNGANPPYSGTWGFSVDSDTAIPNDESIRFQRFDGYETGQGMKLHTDIQPGTHTFRMLAYGTGGGLQAHRHNLVVQHLGWTCL